MIKIFRTLNIKIKYSPLTCVKALVCRLMLKIFDDAGKHIWRQNFSRGILRYAGVKAENKFSLLLRGPKFH